MEANLTNITCVQFAASFVTYKATLWTLIVTSTVLLMCGLLVIYYLLSKEQEFYARPGRGHGRLSLFPSRRIAPTEGIREAPLLRGLTETSVFALVENNLVITNEFRERCTTRDTGREQDSGDSTSYLSRKDDTEYISNFDGSTVITCREVISVEKFTD